MNGDIPEFPPPWQKTALNSLRELEQRDQDRVPERRVSLPTLHTEDGSANPGWGATAHVISEGGNNQVIEAAPFDVDCHPPVTGCHNGSNQTEEQTDIPTVTHTTGGRDRDDTGGDRVTVEGIQTETPVCTMRNYDTGKNFPIFSNNHACAVMAAHVLDLNDSRDPPPS